MKATILFILSVLSLLVIIINGQQYGEEVGTTPCGVEVPPVETDAFNPKESWTAGNRNYTNWENRFNFFTTSSTYTIYDILVKGTPQFNSELVQIWELEPVPTHPGWYHLPEWRRQQNVGIKGGNTHTFGYITKGSPFAGFLSFSIANYTCTQGFQLYA